MGGGNPDFSILMTGDSSSFLNGFGFLQFLQVFFLGDTRVLLSIVPRASVGFFGQDDDILTDTRASKSFLGNPVKNTMLLQSMRRLPIIMTVPFILTVILLMVDLASLLNPMVHRILFAIPSLSPVVAPFLEDFTPHEVEQLDALDGMNTDAFINTSDVGVERSIGNPDSWSTMPSPATGCSCTQNDYSPCMGGDGICSSAGQCQGTGGENIGRCADCAEWVCCKHTWHCHGVTDIMITHFRSLPDKVCSLTLNVREEVCQVRLDLILFDIAAPVCGECGVKHLEIISPAQPNGVLGPGQSRLCGLNTGQHLYLPVRPKNHLILKATAPVTVRVTQIPCRVTAGDVEAGGDHRDGRNNPSRSVKALVGGRSVVVNGTIGSEGRNEACRSRYMIHKHYKRLRAPWGCLQYFEDNQGELRSFNFNARSEVSTGLNYAICVKRTNNGCRMTLTALTFSIPASPYCISGAETTDMYGGLVSESAMVQARARQTLCCTGSWDKGGRELRLPGVNYLGFSGEGEAMLGSAHDPKQNRYFYCGAQLGNGSLVVGSNRGPLIVRVVTSQDYWGQCCLGGSCPVLTPESYCPGGGCLGFLIKYYVNTDRC